MRCILNKQAFSLVELSIVLVILGLLTGGILAGQSLIRASELRAATSEYQRYMAASHTFRDKYFSIPGDFRDATKFWGRLNANADCVTNSGAPGPNANGACDGDGSGIFNSAAAAGQSGERLQFWRHLALAGLIEGSYTGLAGAAGGSDCPLGTVCPKSKLGNGGWGAWVWNAYAGNTETYAGNYGGVLAMGAAYTNAWPVNPLFKPEEAWNIDTKMDDGKPGTGKILPRDSVGFGNANGCTNSTSATDYASSYNLPVSSAVCSLFFANTF